MTRNFPHSFRRCPSIANKHEASRPIAHYQPASLNPIAARPRFLSAFRSTSCDTARSRDGQSALVTIRMRCQKTSKGTAKGKYARYKNFQTPRGTPTAARVGRATPHAHLHNNVATKEKKNSSITRTRARLQLAAKFETAGEIGRFSKQSGSSDLKSRKARSRPCGGRECDLPAKQASPRNMQHTCVTWTTQAYTPTYRARGGAGICCLNVSMTTLRALPRFRQNSLRNGARTRLH